MNRITPAAFSGTNPGQGAIICESDLPLQAAIAAEDIALATIVGVEGAAYRPVGATMAIDAQGRSWGSLSSGCIESDIVIHAREALMTGRARCLRYGRGSPFRDLLLPCGGGLEILLVPRPDRSALRAAAETLRARRPACLVLREGESPPLILHILPQLRFLVFGKGPEARCFSALTAAAGYQVEVFSPDPETLAACPGGKPLSGPRWPGGLDADARTAVTLFFHDHDWEPPLLRDALASSALYVGAQGSLLAHRTRCEALRQMGVGEAAIGRLAAPFGLVPSVRDPRMLAVSVLAQVLDRARLS